MFLSVQAAGYRTPVVGIDVRVVNVVIRGSVMQWDHARFARDELCRMCYIDSMLGVAVLAASR